MTNNSSKLRLNDAWRECNQHVHYLCYALTAIDTLLPFDSQKFNEINDEQVQDIDQLIYRFSKLQDSMGLRLFPAVLACLQEPYDDKPMLDKLNRLEKMGLIASAEQWQQIRTIRNRFAHDYPDDNEKNAELINLACSSIKDLFSIIKNLLLKMQADYPELVIAELNYIIGL